MSRARKPKHLLKLLSERTLLEETVRRLDGVVPPKNIFVLTNAAQLADVRAALPFLPGQIVAEPARRDTAPAAALATGTRPRARPGGRRRLVAGGRLHRRPARFAAQLQGGVRLGRGEGHAAAHRRA